MTPRALIIVENNSVPFDRRVWREACALRDAGWLVSVISPKASHFSAGGTRAEDEDKSYEFLDGIHVYRYALEQAEGGPTAFAREYAIALLQTFRLVGTVWRKHGFDVVQVCNPPDFFFPVGWLCRLTGKGFIFDHHDLVPESVAERWRGLKGRILFGIARAAEWLTFQAAHVVMATNESYREIAIRRGGKAKKRVLVVRNGPRFADLNAPLPKPGLRNDRPYLVGYLGIMGPQDGLLILLEAIRIIIQDKKRTDIQFVLTGDGPVLPTIKERIRDWGISEYVTLPGMAVAREDWLAALSTPDICIAPEPPTAFNQHSTITKIAEYMAFARPIIAFNLKETRVTAGEAAMYLPEPDPVRLADEILALLADPERRWQMSRDGFQRAVTTLTWEAQVPALLRAYALARASA